MQRYILCLAQQGDKFGIEVRAGKALPPPDTTSKNDWSIETTSREDIILIAHFLFHYQPRLFRSGNAGGYCLILSNIISLTVHRGFDDLRGDLIGALIVEVIVEGVRHPAT